MIPIRSLFAGALAVAAAGVFLAACSHQPQPSRVGSAYRGKLQDDTMVEATTTVLVTKTDVVIALDCRPLRDAVAQNDASAIDRAVAAGSAAKLPAGVTLYTLPFSASNPRTLPLVVTDDKYAGRLCTPDAYDVVKT